MTVLGKCAVIMADPPWDIHMELPYGTMSDDEMRQMPVPLLQDEGYIFLWVTGRYVWSILRILAPWLLSQKMTMHLLHPAIQMFSVMYWNEPVCPSMCSSVCCEQHLQLCFIRV